MKVHVCGIDIGKPVFHLVGLSKERVRGRRRNSDPMLKKEAAEMVNHSSFATDPAIPDAVQPPAGPAEPRSCLTEPASRRPLLCLGVP